MTRRERWLQDLGGFVTISHTSTTAVKEHLGAPLRQGEKHAIRRRQIETLVRHAAAAAAAVGHVFCHQCVRRMRPPAQGGVLALLDTAVKAIAQAKQLQWPSKRIYKLGGEQLHATCEGASGKSAKKSLGALDDEAREAAVALIGGLPTGSGLPELAARVPSITVLLL
jgi:hypothetical protein